MDTAVRHFKGQKLQDFLEERILTGAVKSGTPILSENQLAKRFKISKLTVRKVIDEFVAQGFLERQQGRGTFVTKRAESVPERRTTRTVLNLVKTSGHLYGDILRLLIDRIQGAGYAHSMIGTIPDTDEPPRFPRPLAETLDELDDLPLAVICERMLPRHLGALSELRRRGVPLIWLLIDDVPFGSNDHLVAPDNEYGAWLAVKHLYELGHRRLWFATHPVGEAEWSVLERNMRRGFNRAVRDFELGETARPLEYRLSTGQDPAAAERYFRDALSTPERPTAILADQDFAATFIARAAASLGLNVPRDLAIVGYFDTPWAVTFGLTSVNVRCEDVADHVVTLLRLLESEPCAESIRIYVKPRLAIRDSCGASGSTSLLVALPTNGQTD